MTIVPISTIRTDGGTQPRESIDPAVVTEYADAKRAGAEFPPVVVFHDGTDYWLADGFHRVAMHAAIGATEIAADVRQGTQRDAILYSVGANADHGLRRTNADKRRAVLRLLSDSEWSKWSDRKIAEKCAVSDKTVAVYRPVTSEIPKSEDRTYTTRHGTTATMNTARIGKAAPIRHSTADSQLAPDDVAEVPDEEPATDVEVDAGAERVPTAAEQRQLADELDATDPLLAAHAARHSAPEQKPATNGTNGTHKPANGTNRFELSNEPPEVDTVTPDKKFSEAMQQIWHRRNVIDARGGIDALVKSWSPETIDDYLRDFRLLREWCDEVIPKLERSAPCIGRR